MFKCHVRKNDSNVKTCLPCLLCHLISFHLYQKKIRKEAYILQNTKIHVNNSSVRNYVYCRLRLDNFDQVQNSLFVLKLILLLLSLNRAKSQIRRNISRKQWQWFYEESMHILLKTLRTQSVAQVLKYLKGHKLVRFMCWEKVCRSLLY